MKYLNKMSVILFITLLGACSAGVNFNKMTEDQLIVGQTTKAEVTKFMGKANGGGKSTANDVSIEILTYSYAKSGAKAALPKLTPSRSQGLYFMDGILVGKEYTSTFPTDSTLFDTTKASEITNGQSKSDVIALLGEAKGEYIFPIISNKNGHAIVYLCSQSTGFKTKIDTLYVEFDSNNKVIASNLTTKQL